MNYTGQWKRCRNKTCGELLLLREFPICVSCRAAGAYGALLAALIGAALKLLGVI